MLHHNLPPKGSADVTLRGESRVQEPSHFKQWYHHWNII